jgi:nucleoside-diphosphate-sugar epimerase
MREPWCQTGTETDPVNADDPASRGASETIVKVASQHGVRGAIVRLPPTVHGEGDHGFVPQLIAIARASRVAAFVGDGENRWPAVYRNDAATLFRLAVERGDPGAVFHAVAEQGIPMRHIAEVIGRGLGVPTRSLDLSEAPAHFTWMARFVQIDNPVTIDRTQRALGWRPTQKGLIADLEESGYFT